MRVLERPKSPLPSVTRLLPSVHIHKPNIPNMPKLYGKPYHRDEPLLDDSKENEDDRLLQRKLSAVINARRFASNVKSNVSTKTHNFTNKIHLLPTTRHYGYSTTESRDDELQEMEGRHLLTANSDERVFRMNTTFGEERDMPQDPLSLEVVDFGGFEIPVDIKEKETTGTISVSTASEREDNSIDSREYSKMYANITRGVSDDSSYDRESEFSIVTECETSAEPAQQYGIEPVFVNDQDDRSVGSVRSAKELNGAFQLNVPDQDPIVDSHVVDENTETEQLNVDEGLIYERAHITLPVLYDVHEPKEDEVSESSAKEMNLSLNASVVSSCATSSILLGVDIPDESGRDEERVEVFTPSRSNSDDSADYSNVVSNVMVGNTTASSQISTLDDPSFCTPDPAKIPTIPTMSFSSGSPLDERKFLIAEKEIVVTPTDHGEVIVLGGIADADSCSVKDGEQSDCESVCSQDPIATGSNEVEQVNVGALAAVSSSSGEGISSNSSADLTFSGLQVHTFDDDVFNDIKCDDKTEASVFLTRDDWKPEDDTDNSTCSEPFGCCTINVDVKRSIIGASEEVMTLTNVNPPSTPKQCTVTSEVGNESISITPEPFGTCTVDTDIKDSVSKAPENTTLLLNDLSPPNTPKRCIVSVEESPRFIYPEINMLDMISDDSEYGSSTHSSSQADSFQLSDRFRDLNEYMESSSSDEDDESVNSYVNDAQLTKNLPKNNDSDHESEVVSYAAILTPCDDRSVDQESLVSSILNDSNRTMSAVSDEEVANFEVLKNFWTLEWLGVAKVQNKGTVHSTDGASVADCESNRFCDGNEDFGDECNDLNHRLLLSRNLLETVEEEMLDESDNDSAGDSVISKAMSSDSSCSSNTEENNVKYEDDGVCGYECESDSPEKAELVFHPSRHTKKSYMRVKKWAVTKAKSKAFRAKYILDHISREINAKDYDNESLQSQNYLSPAPEIDEAVKTALDLISRREKFEVDLEKLQRQPSTSAIENEDNNDIVESDEYKIKTESDYAGISTLIIPTGPIQVDDDRLGQLTNYLSPNAKEHRVVEDLKDQNKEGKNNEPETPLRVVVTEINKDESASSISEAEADENSNQHIEESEDEDIRMVEKTPSNQDINTFDDVHVPELGTLTQKLYYTNTELAETLTRTQSELEMSKRRIEALLVDRDQLLIATASLQKSKEVVANGTQDDTLELQIWLDEKNDLID